MSKQVYLLFRLRKKATGVFYAPDYVQFFRLCHRLCWRYNSFECVGTSNKIPPSAIRYGFGVFYDANPFL